MKLDPAAVAVNGKPIDDDWKVTQVTTVAAGLQNERTGTVAVLGHDAVYCFWSDAGRSTDKETFGVPVLS